MSGPFVIFVCDECGNYVAEPTVVGAERPQLGGFRHGGGIFCTRATHGIYQPEMRRLELREVPAGQS